MNEQKDAEQKKEDRQQMIELGSDITKSSETVETKVAGQPLKIRVLDCDEDKLMSAIRQPITVCSLLLRDDGFVYDEWGGQADIKNKILRKTNVPVKDKNAFCTFCFEQTLKRGFVPDGAVRDEMKKMVTFPPQKKIQLIMSVRGHIKSQQFRIEYVLNALSYDGLFTGAGTISMKNKNKLEMLLRKANTTNISLLLCYLAGIRSDQLKAVMNFDIPRESYEKICRFVKDGEIVDMAAIHNQYSDEEAKEILFLAEFTTLLAGGEFVVKETRSILFRSFDKSDFWKKILGEEKKPEPNKNVSKEPPKSAAQEMEAEPPDMLGGLEDDGYEIEESDGEGKENSGDNSVLNLRNSERNPYVKNNF